MNNIESYKHYAAVQRQPWVFAFLNIKKAYRFWISQAKYGFLSKTFIQGALGHELSINSVTKCGSAIYVLVIFSVQRSKHVARLFEKVLVLVGSLFKFEPLTRLFRAPTKVLKAII